MLNLEYLLPLVCFWHTISSELSKYKPDAIANNIVCSIHCVLYILHHNYNYNMDYVIHMSLGYYTYDLLYIFACIYKKNTKDIIMRRVPYIIHHLAGIYLLHDTLISENTGPLLYAYNLLETSNIMIYISYHLHKEYANHPRVIMISEFIQLVWYVYYRIICFSSFVYNNQTRFLEFCVTSRCMIVALYCMGVAWSYNLVKRNIMNLETLKKPNGD